MLQFVVRQPRQRDIIEIVAEVFQTRIMGKAGDLARKGPTQCVGPDYRAENQKPTATVSVEVPYDNVITLPQTPQLIALLT